MEHFFSKKSEIESKLNYCFQKPELLFLAFVHRSYWNENQQSVQEHNERLEFLGDSVLGLIIADYLYCSLPDVDEGNLSRLRAQLIDAPACAAYIQHIELEEYILLGKGEQTNQGKGRESILADLFEAIIGAIYLDGGFQAAEKFILSHFASIIEERVKKPLRNWKADLQDYTQRTFHETPEYEVLEESGLAHEKVFRVSVSVQARQLGVGEGSSKKEAQVDAAKNALEQL